LNRHFIISTSALKKTIKLMTYVTLLPTGWSAAGHDHTIRFFTHGSFHDNFTAQQERAERAERAAAAMGKYFFSSFCGQTLLFPGTTLLTMS
jgi:hypothetical protein